MLISTVTFHCNPGSAQSLSALGKIHPFIHLFIQTSSDHVIYQPYHQTGITETQATLRPELTYQQLYQ